MARHNEARSSRTAHRRFAAAVLAVVGIAGLSIASAAQLNLTGAPLGAGATVVATCQGSGTITVSFPTAWNATATPAAYRVTSVTLAGVNSACAGKPYRIQLLNASSAALGAEITGTVPNPVTGGTFTTATIAAASQARAQDLANVSIVIQG